MGDTNLRCVIVGAGHAAAQLCASLRQSDWLGAITVVGDEASVPYHRPPLSKSQLNPNGDAELQPIRPPDFYEANDIRLQLGDRVVSIDREARRVSTRQGRSIDYDALVLATGSVHRRPPIPGIDDPHVFSLRTAADARAVREKVDAANAVAVIGAGFIGLEVAASLRQLGVAVTVFELAERVLSRVTSPEVSTYFEDLHRGHGVDLRTGVGVSGIEPRDGRLVVAGSGSGDEVVADFVVVGAGAAANDQLARAAGLEVDNGILVDAQNRTSDPHIFAMGDCCNQFHALYDSRLRLESVQNAADQAKTVAAAITGGAEPAPSLPWFWSDQYDVKLQIAGISAGYDRCVIRGKPQPGESFSAWYVKGDRLLAVDAVNDPRAYVVGSKLIPQGRCPDLELLADTGSDMKTILNSASEPQA